MRDLEFVIERKKSVTECLSSWLRAEVRREVKASKEQLRAMGLIDA